MAEIRDTQPADAEKLAALIESVARERQFLASTIGFTVDDSRAFISSVKEAGGVHVVAAQAGEIIGWCDVAPSPFEGMRHVGRLGMGVQKSYRGQGVGPKLLESAIQKAFASQIDLLELEVFASNRAAISLYEKFGFRLEGRKVGGRKLDGIVDDVLLYAKDKKAQRDASVSAKSIDIAQHGIILFVKKYEECVAFYRDVVSLEVAYSKESLTCFRFGSAYLMVEDGGTSASQEKRRDQNPTVLRFDVTDLEAAAAELAGKGVLVERHSFDWGCIAVFVDPDGNRCELKSAPLPREASD